jgi:hypothetical protein
VAKNETLNRLFAKSNRSALGKNGKMDPPLVRAAGCKFIVAPHRFPTYVVPRHFLLSRRGRKESANDKLDVLLFEEDLLRRTFTVSD